MLVIGSSLNVKEASDLYHALETYMVHNVVWGDLLYDLNKRLWEWKSEGLIAHYGVNPFPYNSYAHIAFILDYVGMAEMWDDPDPGNKMNLVRQILRSEYGLTVYKVLWEQAKAKEDDKHG